MEGVTAYGEGIIKQRKEYGMNTIRRILARWLWNFGDMLERWGKRLEERRKSMRGE